MDVDALAEVASRARQVRLRPGERTDEGPLVVLSGGLRILDGQGRTVDVMASHELWLPTEGTLAEAVGETELALLPEEAGELAWRGVDAASLVPTPELRTPLSGPVEALLLPVPLLDPATPTMDAARRLETERATAVLVETAEGLGIVTDHDFRSRLVARGMAPNTPVGEIATRPLLTITAGASLSDALAQMLEAGINHLPVVDAGRVIGILEGHRLLSTVGAGPMGLRHEVAIADVDGLGRIHDLLPKAAEDLLASGMGALGVLQIVTGLSDAIYTRVFELSPPPPGEFAWIALGSQGRREQGLGTDQDHALVLGDGEDEPAFAEWGAAVSQTLEEIGYPLCPGGIMAGEPAWRHTVAGWRRWQRERLANTEPHAVLDAATAVDGRLLAGVTELGEFFEQLRREAGQVAPFMSRLAAAAAHFRVPLGFLGRIIVERSGEEAGHFDIKKGAIGPITALARVVGLASGSGAVSTSGRLADAEAAGELSPALTDFLQHGLELSLGLRLNRHLDCWRAGEPYDDQIDPETMDAWERRLLKEVFGAIRELQGALETRFQTEYVR